LHIGYETVEPWPLVRTDTPDVKARAGGVSPRVILRAEKAAGRVVLDSETVLDGLPAEAWGYRLGNRSGVEWVLDQHKEKTPRDATIREKFNGYRFADHKERVVGLIGRVARVSVETMAIVGAMAAVRRAGMREALSREVYNALHILQACDSMREIGFSGRLFCGATLGRWGLPRFSSSNGRLVIAGWTN
jgi:hypothetical protein